MIRGYEPMLSYYRNAPTLRRRGGSGLSRRVPGHGTVRPVFWSPIASSSRSHPVRRSRSTRIRVVVVGQRPTGVSGPTLCRADGPLRCEGRRQGSARSSNPSQGPGVRARPALPRRRPARGGVAQTVRGVSTARREADLLWFSKSNCRGASSTGLSKKVAPPPSVSQIGRLRTCC